MDQTKKFANQEAQDKVGCRVRSVVAFSGVEKGANGRVLAAHLESDGYSLEIEWDRPPGPKPYSSRVSKYEYEHFLIET